MEDEKTLRYVEIISTIRQMTPLNLEVVLHKQKNTTLISVTYRYEELLEVCCSNKDDKVKVCFGMFNTKEYPDFIIALADIRKHIATYNITEYSREITSSMIADKYRMLNADSKDISAIEVKKDSHKGQPYFRVNIKGVKGIFYSGYNARLIRKYGANKMKKVIGL